MVNIQMEFVKLKSQLNRNLGGFVIWQSRLRANIII